MRTKKEELSGYCGCDGKGIAFIVVPMFIVFMCAILLVIHPSWL